MKGYILPASSVLLLIKASVLHVSCNGGGTSTIEDAGVETAEDAEGDLDVGGDLLDERCYYHPNTCNSGGMGMPAFDCCLPPKRCCNLCYPQQECGRRAECLRQCPLTMPCEGIPNQNLLSCYWFPEEIEGTVYCHVSSDANPLLPLPCSSSCPAGRAVCPMPRETFGDAALCCPEGWICETVEGYNLPRCTAP